MPSITVDKFYGGISEDDRLGQEGTYIYSENLDIQKDMSTVQLTSISTNLMNITSYDKDINVTIEAEGKIILGCEDGLIFKEGVTAPVYTESTGGDIIGMFVNSDDLMFITYHGATNALKYHTIALSDISNSSWAGKVTENKISITTLPTSGLLAIKQIGNFCYLGVGDNIVKISYSRTTSTYSYDVFDFPNKTITGITYSGAVIKLFQEDGILYLWDGVSETKEEAISLDVPIRNVISIANIDYVVGGYSDQYTEFFYLNGYTLVPIFKRDYSQRLNNTKINIESDGALQNYLTYKKGNIYMTTKANSKRGISVFGSGINGINKGISIINTKSSFGYNYSSIFGVYARGISIYVMYKDSNGNIGVDTIPAFTGTTFQKEGELYSLVYNCGNSVIEKQFKELEVRAKGVTTSIKITVKYSIDGNNFTTLGDVTEDGITYFSMDSTDRQSFRDISFKFEFDATDFPTALGTNIQFYGFTMDYDFNK